MRVSVSEVVAAVDLVSASGGGGLRSATHRTVKPPPSAGMATQKPRVRCGDWAFRALVALFASARVSQSFTECAALPCRRGGHCRAAPHDDSGQKLDSLRQINRPTPVVDQSGANSQLFGWNYQAAALGVSPSSPTRGCLALPTARRARVPSPGPLQAVSHSGLDYAAPSFAVTMASSSWSQATQSALVGLRSSLAISAARSVSAADGRPCSRWRAIADLSAGSGGACGVSFCMTCAPSGRAPSFFFSRF